MDLTRDDLNQVAGDLKDYIRERCDRIERRQDTANGKLMKHERELGEHQQRIKGVEHELYNSLVEIEPEEVAEEDKPALTKHDVKLLWAILAGVGGALAAAAEIYRAFQ
jgi:hypothetical protein